MDYPDLVNTGKPRKMKKKSKVPVSRTPQKDRKDRAGGLPGSNKASGSGPRRRTPAGKLPAKPSSGRSNDKSTIRGLKAELATARARIIELEASADTDFLL